MSDKILRLSDIDPKLAAELNADETVVMFGPTICGDCTASLRLLGLGKVRAVKYTIDDSEHPVIVACKEYLGVSGGKVSSPFVFEFGVFSWTGMDTDEILRVTTAQKFAQQAVSVA